MAIIPSSTQFVGISPSVNLEEKKSNRLNAETQPYTMQDIIDTASSPPAGTAGQIQFSDGSAFAADPGLFWDNTNKRFFVSGTVVNAAFYNSGQTYDPANPANDFVFGPRTLRVAGNGLFIDNFDGASNTALSFGEGQATKMSFYYQPVGGNPGLTMRNNYAGNTMMRWNRANNYLSINDYNSSAQLYVKSSGSTSATTSLLVQNSSASDVFKITDDRVSTFYNTAGSTAAGFYFDANPNSRVLVRSHGSADFSQIQIGNNFLLSRNGGGNPSIGTSFSLTYYGQSHQLFGIGSVPGNLQIRGDYGLGSAKFGAYNNAGSTLIFGNEYNSYFYTQQVVAVNNKWAISDTSTGPTIPASSMFSLESTTQGFLPPRMTTAQKLAIATPAAGLMVYDTSLNQMSYYNGSAWVNF